MKFPVLVAGSCTYIPFCSSFFFLRCLGESCTIQSQSRAFCRLFQSATCQQMKRAKFFCTFEEGWKTQCGNKLRGTISPLPSCPWQSLTWTQVQGVVHKGCGKNRLLSNSSEVTCLLVAWNRIQESLLRLISSLVWFFVLWWSRKRKTKPVSLLFWTPHFRETLEGSFSAVSTPIFAAKRFILSFLQHV